MITCPRCTGDIPVRRLGSTFRCPWCLVPLRSNYSSTLLWVVPLAIFAEAALYLLLYRAIHDWGVALFVWSFVGGVTAVICYWVLMHVFCQVSRDDTSNAI
jgi:hypothetical protein